MKSGLNYGVDYTIYNTLPSKCHSEMCVTVVDAVTTTGTVANSTDNMSWRHLSTLTRVTPVRDLRIAGSSSAVTSYQRYTLSMFPDEFTCFTFAFTFAFAIALQYKYTTI